MHVLPRSGAFASSNSAEYRRMPRMRTRAAHGTQSSESWNRMSQVRGSSSSCSDSSRMREGSDNHGDLLVWLPGDVGGTSARVDKGVVACDTANRLICTALIARAPPVDGRPNSVASTAICANWSTYGWQFAHRPRRSRAHGRRQRARLSHGRSSRARIRLGAFG